MARSRFFALLLCLLLALLFGAQLFVCYLPPAAITSLHFFEPLFSAYSNDIAASVLLRVSPVIQLPELPNGCEGTSLTATLCYLGYPADKVDIATNYITCMPLELEGSTYFGADPHEAYVGDPTQASHAFYCLGAPLAQAANRYLAAHRLPESALDITGAGEETLLYYLSNGQPVIVWATLGMRVPYQTGFEWVLPSGDTYTAFSNLHCYVLKGYDADFFYLTDPIYGEAVAYRTQFMERYEALGSNAVVLNAPYRKAPRRLSEY